MAENKIISYDVELLSTNKRREFYIPEVYTNDLYSNEFQFNILDVPVGDLAGATARILLDMRDGSFFNNADVTRSGNVFKYVLKANEGKHYGIAKVQLVVVIGGKDYATPLYNFAVMQGLDDKKANEVVINDLNSETRKEIAKLKSETNTIITDLSAQWQQVIDETTGKDIVSAPEIIAARGKDESLGVRLNRFDEFVGKRRKNSVFFSEKSVAHRGVSEFAPENTMAAFDLAYKMGFHSVETDVLKTSDGHYIIFHDTTVDRMTDGTGAVSNMTLSQIKALTISAGNGIEKYDNLKIPTLDEFLSFCKEKNIIPMIEAKFIFSETDCQNIITALEKYGLANHAILIAYQIETLEKLRKYSQDVILLWILETWKSGNVIEMTSKGIDGCSLSYSIALKDTVEICHENGLLVSAFTFNTQHSIRDKKSLKLDYMLSDFINVGRV